MFKSQNPEDWYIFTCPLIFISVHNYFNVHWAIQWLNATDQRSRVVKPTGVHVLYIDTCKVYRSN